MSVESRMEGFEKVANKEEAHDVSKLMDEFQEVYKAHKTASKDKLAALPFGIKSVRLCPECGEFMEIKEIMEGKAIYYCKGCREDISIIVEK